MAKRVDDGGPGTAPFSARRQDLPSPDAPNWPRL